MSTTLRTVAGLLLYRQLPEEYRYRDNASASEVGDLEAYLHGFGHVLDGVRGLLEQLYADAFAEQVEFPFVEKRVGADDLPVRGLRTPEIQPWMLPYLADLLGAELIAPDIAARRTELERSVLWSQSRGTVRTMDDLSDVVANAETVVVEGWRRVVTTPNVALPPFTRELIGAMAERRLPRGTVDVRRRARAVEVAWPEDPLARGRFTGRDTGGQRTSRDVAWQILDPTGTPCFPESFEDPSVRTPDVRTPDWRVGHSNPSRVVVHVRPPFGFFEPGLKEVSVASTAFQTDSNDAEVTFGPSRGLEIIETTVDDVTDDFKLIVKGDVEIIPGVSIILCGLLFRGTITVRAGAKLRMVRCAANEVVLEKRSAQPAPCLEAHDCLFGDLSGADDFAMLEYVTVLGTTKLRRLWASDCLFVGSVSNIRCGPTGSCVRFSRLPEDTPVTNCKALLAPPNTTAPPLFSRFYRKKGGKCVFEVPAYGEPGCGVLDIATPAWIAQGAEDEGEMGGHHHLHHMARLRALKRKLDGHCPARIEPVLTVDPRLSAPPPRQGTSQ